MRWLPNQSGSSQLVGIEGLALPGDGGFLERPHEAQVVAAQDDAPGEPGKLGKHAARRLVGLKVAFAEQHDLAGPVQPQGRDQKLVGDVAGDHGGVERLLQFLSPNDLDAFIDHHHRPARLMSAQHPQIAVRHGAGADDHDMMMDAPHLPGTGRENFGHSFDHRRCGQNRGAEVGDPEEAARDKRSPGGRADVQATNDEQPQAVVSLGQQTGLRDLGPFGQADAGQETAKREQEQRQCRTPAPVGAGPPELFPCQPHEGAATVAARVAHTEPLQGMGRSRNLRCRLLGR